MRLILKPRRIRFRANSHAQIMHARCFADCPDKLFIMTLLRARCFRITIEAAFPYARRQDSTRSTITGLLSLASRCAGKYPLIHRLSINGFSSDRDENSPARCAHGARMPLTMDRPARHLASSRRHSSARRSARTDDAECLYSPAA